MSRGVDIRAMFLGPKGGNRDLLLELVAEAISDQAHWRRNFHPDDPPVITEVSKTDPHFQATRARLKDEVARMLAELRGSVPFFSPRYIAHMNSDILIPAIVGYIAAMLYNPNNVTAESSPITTEYEIEVADDLARLLGYDAKKAFGHLTSGGTTANYEALWIARDLRYLPLLARDLAMAGGVDVDLRLANGVRAPIDQCDEWSLLNVEAAEAIRVYEDVREALGAAGMEEADVQEHAKESRHSIGERGLYGQSAGLVVVPATGHYSWLKAVELLGLGRRAIRSVPVDGEFRMSMPALDGVLREAEAEQHPVIAIVGVFGTTEEGSIDPLDEIVSLRGKYRARGLDAFLHVDAAYGGYARALFLDARGREKVESRLLPDCDWPSPAIYRAQQALREADAVTVDPHKLGYVPYSAGAIVFKDRRWRELIRTAAPYIIHTMGAEEDDTFIGQYILEGSKAGAAAAAVCLAHRVLPTNESGYGALIGRSIRGIQQVYRRFSDEREWAFEADIRVAVHPLVRPDLNVFCFVANRVGNESLEKMNALNNELYRQMSYERGKALGAHQFFISKTEFREGVYGEAGEGILHRAGVETADYRAGREGIVVLRMTLMHPWYEGHMEPDLVDAFGREVRGGLQKLIGSRRELFY